MDIDEFEATPEDVVEQRTDPAAEPSDPEHPIPDTESGLEADPADVAEQDKPVVWPEDESS